MNYNLFYTPKKVFNYSLFAGQEVFPDAEEILPILSEAFDETFLKRKRKARGGYN